MDLALRLRALFLRRDGDIGQVRSRDALLAWTRVLPRLPCATAVPGERGWFAGRARRFGSLAEGPLSSKPALRVDLVRDDCVPYQCHVSEGDDFVVEDASGAAVVPFTSSLEMFIDPDPHFDIYSARPYDRMADVRDDRLVDLRGLHRVRSLPGKGFAYRERRLWDGQNVVILGSAAPRDAAAPFRDAGPTAMIVPAPDAVSLYLTDLIDDDDVPAAPGQ